MSKGGRKPRKPLRITVSERAYQVLEEKARARGMSIELWLGEQLDLEMGIN